MSTAGARNDAAAILLVVLVLLLVPAVLAGPAQAQDAPRSAAAAERRADAVLLVLDASGSMNDPADATQSRLDAAREAIEVFVTSADPALDIGLRVFGHRFPSGSPQTCTDSENLVPVGADRDAITQAISGIEASGDTPIGYSLQEGVSDLPADSEDPVIVLVSDGLSDCTDDRPCEVAQELVARGIDVTIDTIGFQVDAAAERQLTCIAEATGGLYVAADEVVELVAVLQAYRPTGEVIRGGDVLDEAVDITSGQYLDAASVGDSRWYAVDITDGQQIRVAATLVSPPDGPFAPDAQLQLTGWVPDAIGLNECAADVARGVGRDALQVAADLSREDAPRVCTEEGRFFVQLELLDAVAAEDSALAGVEHTIELFVSVADPAGEAVEEQTTSVPVVLPPPPPPPTPSGGGPSGLVVVAVGGLLGVAAGSVAARRQGL